ncbi:MAG: dihem cytochrome c family protein [Cyanobacteria bacterium]|nr:dihem cytochrome c family protein [Cyanobacteria bacterium CG_2015-16_32_12]NCO77772.1 dihem cytochrome c family protein [Cyanobacteria bacterium CG_2015-22_32_23]NCQ04216.1 dihem cytochrome c family protein [Cyanobacteria bacterium CG_2015-09_32_10]NCQ42179.1 dihem cytochrome c family protein [Cyanobacteria bacterium CG_2015-04_32_10]NCS83395.1 dihem cytochrome c family protein [Cyanobacteria bacterium CG_2015-02_32_10]
MNKRAWITIIISFILSWSIVIGWSASRSFDSMAMASVDKATGNFKIGEDLYVENCATCHIPIPPSVLPQETWQEILETPTNHYGTKVEGLTGFTQRLMWQYLQNYSRQLLKDEIKPKYMAQSRYFFALHPQINFSSTITINSCIECHSQGQNFDYSYNE